jgi:hypothetical protein
MESEPRPQREAAGVEAEKTDVGRHPDGGEGMGEDTPSKPKSKDEEEKEEGEITPPL